MLLTEVKHRSLNMLLTEVSLNMIVAEATHRSIVFSCCVNMLSLVAQNTSWLLTLLDSFHLDDVTRPPPGRKMRAQSIRRSVRMKPVVEDIVETAGTIEGDAGVGVGVGAVAVDGDDDDESEFSAEFSDDDDDMMVR